MATSGAARHDPSRTRFSWSTQWRHDLFSAGALFVIATVVAVHGYRTTPKHWGDPDSLYYRAWVLRLQGVSKPRALETVFSGPLARHQREAEQGLPESRRRVTSPRWINYSSQFYGRRWVTPLLGAALDPIFGASGLIVTSLIGYVLLAPLLYALLRQGYAPWPSTIAVAIILLLHTVREWALWPMTDMFGLAVETLALVTGLLALRRGGRWIVAWTAAVVVLSFTRDATLVVLGGALLAFVIARNRRSLALLATGIVAALPAPLLFGAPLRETIAYTINDFFPPRNPSWGFIAAHFPDALRALIRDDVKYLENHPVDALVLVGGFLALLIFGRTLASNARPFVFGAAICALASLLIVPNYSLFRLELVLVPFCALGVAAAVSLARARLTGAPRSP